MVAGVRSGGACRQSCGTRRFSAIAGTRSDSRLAVARGAAGRQHLQTGGSLLGTLRLESDMQGQPHRSVLDIRLCGISSSLTLLNTNIRTTF